MSAWIAAAGGASAQPVQATQWVTLGTNGGPVLNPDRSEPANLLIVAGRPMLVDCGDGAAERLAAAGYQPAAIDTVFISHLHIDHIGGLQGLIGLRWMTGAKTPLTIYGPPGIEAVVSGILQSLKPSVRLMDGLPGVGPPPEQTVRVVTLNGATALVVAGVQVTTVANSHFDIEPGVSAQNGSQSLSFRFATPGETVFFTGDTGPSSSVAKLAAGADLLVSEVIDLDPMVAMAKHMRLPPAAEHDIIQRFEIDHLSPQDAGRLATQAGAKRLVLTHLSARGPYEQIAPRLLGGVRETYSGPATVARDLDRF